MTNNAPIGVFDSGVGGLTVLQALTAALPHENFIYLGDTARLPYGTKSATSVQRYAEEAVHYLQKQNIKFLVLACNTVTAEALETLKQGYSDIPIIGVIEPGAMAAVSASSTQRIGILSTRATLNSNAYPRAIHKIAPKAAVFVEAAPLLVSLAEEAWLNDSITATIITRYLSPLLAQSIDCLLLGCTHYPLLAPLIRQCLPPSIALVDSASTTAKATALYLKTLNLLNPQNTKGQTHFFVTDDPTQFTKTGTLFLSHPILQKTVTLINL